MSHNGETTVEQKHLSYNEKLDVLIAGLAELSEKVDGLVEQYDEVMEKLSNLTASGSGFSEDEFGES